MKRLLLLCFATLLSVATWAAGTTQSFTNGDGVTIYYILSSLSTGVGMGSTTYSATVTYDPDKAESGYNSYSGTVVVPSTVVQSGIRGDTTYDVTSVGENAFYLSTGLTAVTLPSSITSVGKQAFSGCTGLTSITIQAESAPTCGDNAFDQVDKDSCVLYVPEGCVGTYQAADGWKDFTNIKVIGEEEENDSDDSDEGVDEEEDDGTPLAAGTKFFSDGLYYNVVSSEKKTIEVTYAVEKAGYVMSPDDVYYSGSFDIPETVRYQGVTYTVIGIGDSAFGYCNGVSAVTIPKSVTYIGDYGFYNCYLLKELVLPDGLTSIGESAFLNCSNIEEMTIPEGVTTISKYLFEECYSLKRVSLPDALTEIGQEAFCYCNSLTDITIPAGVTSIGKSAFEDCTSLGSLTSLSTTPPTVVSTSFKNVRTDACVLYVPADSIEAYTAADVWKEFTTVQEAGKTSNYEIETLAPTEVTGTTARLNGRVHSNASGKNAPQYSIYIDYWAPDGQIETIDGTDESVKDSDDGDPDAFYVELTGLSKGTAYGYRIGVVENNDSIYGKGESFITGNYDVADNGIYYNIISDDEETCEVTYGGARDWNGTPSYSGSVTIPASVTIGEKTYTVVRIGDSAFDSCINMTSIVLPTTLVYIGPYAFFSCNGLKEIVIPDSVTVVGDYSFEDSDNLEKVTMGSSVAFVGLEAFSQCRNLKSVTLGEAVVIIDNMAFGYCALEEIVIPNAVKWLGISVFSMNYNLRKVTIGESLTEIPGGTFSENKSLDEVTFLGKITTIDQGAFRGCTSLPSIDLPTSLETIGQLAFANCTSLASIVIPDNVETLGEGAFMDCSSLKEATIGSSIMKLSRTFSNCSALEEVTSLNIGAPECDVYTFENVDKTTCILYVPEGAYNEYSKAQVWESFENIVEMIKFEVETYDATDVAETSATLNGYVKEGYKDPVSRKGFIYWSNDANVVTTITIDGDSKDISYTLSNLSPDTKYTYHTFAISGNSITYGDDVEFTTGTDSTTGITSISLDDENIEGIYSISGQQLTTTQHGVNIIRYTDGTVRKIYVK